MKKIIILLITLFIFSGCSDSVSRVGNTYEINNTVNYVTNPEFNSSGLINETYANATYLIKTNNLNDLTDVPTARNNLGLGTMATQSADAYLLDTTDTFTGELTVNSINTGFGGSATGLDIYTKGGFFGTHYGVDVQMVDGGFTEGAGLRINGNGKQIFDLSTTYEQGGGQIAAKITANNLEAGGLAGGLLSIESSESSFKPEGFMLQTKLSASPSAGSHYRAVTGTEEVFNIDVSGNMIPFGSYLHGSGGIGGFGNLLKNSNQFDKSDWGITNYVTITPNFGTSPHGIPNASTQIDPIGFGGGSQATLWGQTITGEAVSGKTYTMSCWGKKTSGGVEESIRFKLTTSTGSENTGNTALSFNSPNWEYRSYTHTFGAVSGDLRFENTNSNPTALGEIYGCSVVEGSDALSFLSTNNYTLENTYGTVTNGDLTIAGDDVSIPRLRIIGSADQGTTNLFEISDSSNVNRMKIDPDYNMEFPGRLAYGEASLDPNTVMNTEFSNDDTTFGLSSAAIRLQLNIDDGFFSIPTGMYSKMVINGGTSSIPVPYRAEIHHETSQGILFSYSYLSQLFSSAASVNGTWGPAYHYAALGTAFAGAKPSSIIGFFSQNQGATGITNAIGVQVDKQLSATNNYGIVLNGDGIGADIMFGAGKDANMYYNGSDLIINPKLVGTGKLIVQGNTTIDNDLNVLGNYQTNGVNGISGNFTTADNKTVIVTNGLITSIT